MVGAISAAESAHQAMLDQQGGLRGYAVTGQRTFLQAYERGEQALPVHNRALERLVGDDVPELVLELRLQQSAWLDRWVERALVAGRDGGLAGAPLEDLLLEGKELFDDYRRAEVALSEQLVRDRDAALDAQERAISRTALLALALTATAGVLSFTRGRSLRRRLDDAVAEVDHRLERIGAGDLVARPAGGRRAPAELERIHDGLDAATAQLGAHRSTLEQQAVRAETHNRQLNQVLRFAREVAGSLNLRYVLRGLCSAVVEITRADRVVVWLRTEDGEHLEAVADSRGPALAPVGLEPVPMGEGRRRANGALRAHPRHRGRHRRLRRRPALRGR